MQSRAAAPPTASVMTTASASWRPVSPPPARRAATRGRRTIASACGTTITALPRTASAPKYPASSALRDSFAATTSRLVRQATAERPTTTGGREWVNAAQSGPRGGSGPASRGAVATAANVAAATSARAVAPIAAETSRPTSARGTRKMGRGTPHRANETA